MNRKRQIGLIALVLLLVSSGFIKDFFMLNINHVLKHLQKGIADYAYPGFHFLENWTVKEILILKWGFTLFFFFYFWLISFYTLKLYLKPNSKEVNAITYVYVALFVLAGGLYTIGILTGIDKSMYHVVRTITGLAHSFMPTMVVYLYIKYFPKGA